MISYRFVLALACLALVPSASGGSQAVQPPANLQAAAPAQAQLEALEGEYTNPVEPDTPLSFYVQGGKLTVESERRVPTELKPVSAIEFGFPDTKATLRFTLDAAGHLLRSHNAPLHIATAHVFKLDSAVADAEAVA